MNEELRYGTGRDRAPKANLERSFMSEQVKTLESALEELLRR